MVPLSMTLSDLWPGFQGHDIFRHWISQKWHEIELQHRTSIGSHMHSIEWWHFRWPWRTPNPVFNVIAYLKSNISKTVRLRLGNYTQSIKWYHFQWPSVTSDPDFKVTFLHYALSLAAQYIVIGPVYMCVCLCVCGFVYLFVCGSVTMIARNCMHRSSPNWVCRWRQWPSPAD